MEDWSAWNPIDVEDGSLELLRQPVEQTDSGDEILQLLPALRDGFDEIWIYDVEVEVELEVEDGSKVVEPVE